MQPDTRRVRRVLETMPMRKDNRSLEVPPDRRRQEVAAI